MSEEQPKKEEVQAQPPDTGPAAKVETAPKLEAAPKSEGAPPKAEAETKAKPEKKRNCAVCNKLMKKGRWYYRNGKYYCTKRCWKSTLKKEEPAQGAS